MKLGMIGLGRMGNALAERVINAGHTVIGFDLDQDNTQKAQKLGVEIVPTVVDVAQKVSVVWLMVPPGDVVDSVIKQIMPHMKANDIIIDGGNSNFKDSMRRAKLLAMQNIFFLDCGTSGGIAGRHNGFSLMVGGDEVPYTKVHTLFTAIAAPGGVAHVGPSGAGHYVKMVHNGIEYALLQAYAEGFQLLKEGSFKDAILDLEKITRVWNNGSVIRSWLLELSQDVFTEDQQLTAISGEVAEGGTGAWTVEDAHIHKVPVPLIEKSLEVRRWSRESGGNYATKVIALLRNKFGGHVFKKIKK